MSNVLIGIIGVVLFIGLALAGALFLGPRFQESTNNSRAAASIQAVSQISSAANMFNVQEGRIVALDTGVTELATTGYLKSVPTNPTNGTAPALVEFDDMIAGPDAVEMVLTDNAEAVCDAIAKQTGTETAAGTAPDARPAGPAGCYDNAGAFTAFARI